MKLEYRNLRDLTEKTDAYKIKVKVIKKSKAQQSPTKPTRYQRLILKDEKGDTMKATIFNKDIEGFAEALQWNGEYEISGAPIQPIPEKFQSKANEFQMTLNDKVTITPLTTDQNLLQPQYLNISDVPRNPDHEDLLDVLGIVLFVEETREIKRNESATTYVREVVITDDSNEQPMIVSTWNDLARVDCNVLNTWAHAFVAVGFTTLKTKPHKGLSLSTTVSSQIILDPQGVKADALRNWALNNEMVLEDRRVKVLQLRGPPGARVITTIAEINSRTASKTWIEERFWFKVIASNNSKDDIYEYLGCNQCGRKGGDSENKSYACQNCSATNTIAVKRLAFRIKAMDESGSLPLTLFNKDVEIVLDMSCADIISNLHKREETPLDECMKRLSSTPFFLQIGPTNALTKSQILTWAVKGIAFE